MDPHLYNISIKWTEGRKGVMCSPELDPVSPKEGCLEVATPPPFPGGIEGLWSPEHLFTASVSSCFMTTFLAIAEFSKLDFKEFSCESKGKLEKVDNKFRMSEVLLEPTVIINEEKDYDRALRILEKAEAACLITNSINAKVTMKPNIETATHMQV